MRNETVSRAARCGRRASCCSVCCTAPQPYIITTTTTTTGRPLRDLRRTTSYLHRGPSVDTGGRGTTARASWRFTVTTHAASVRFGPQLEIHCDQRSGGKSDGQRTSSVRLPIRGQRGPPGSPGAKGEKGDSGTDGHSGLLVVFSFKDVFTSLNFSSRLFPTQLNLNWTAKIRHDDTISNIYSALEC